MDRESFRSLVGADTVIPMTKDRSVAGGNGNARPNAKQGRQWLSCAGRFRTRSKAGLCKSPLPDKPIASARLCLTLMRTTRSGTEPRRCRVLHRGGVCREVRVAPDVLACAEPQMIDRGFPLPLRERVRQEVKGGPRTPSSRQPPHPALRATFSARGEGRAPPASPRVARLEWMAGSSPAMTAERLAMASLHRPSWHQAERTRTRRPGPTAARPALCAPAGRCYSGAIRGRPRGHAHPSRSFQCLKSK